ncbi:UNKNOWN [Stylonychia lemnae]|uniref:Uncharacterized protein n=1 Tax=Stylonychia lemnae TaxID=5949 RepID=A0A078AV73_STYLE|nr:UNKNOWN [Stylonychia lemnae]|eukprot:CDW84758.1 UNKNOWN [Stylonychia lemnae]
MFKSRNTENQNRFDMSLQSEQTQQQPPKDRSYAEILSNIQKFQNNISHKTQVGYSLAKQITNEIPLDMYQRQQMYEIFIQKMDAVYKSELRYQKRLKKEVEKHIKAPLYSLSPLKDILRSYNKLTARGFNSELLTQTLRSLDQAQRARGFRGRYMNDYSQDEFEQSWRMAKVFEDIQFGLRKDQYFSPTHMAQTASLLGEMECKNNKLMPLFFEKINALLDERYNGIKDYGEQSSHQIIFGGFKNFLSRHYVYKGFQNSEEFDHYVNILVNWKNENKQPLSKKTLAQMSQEVKELEDAMKSTISAAVQVKEMQRDLSAALENVRTQYYKLLETSDKHAFLQENEYIRYDILELQELLVRAGYLDPEEALKHFSQEPFENRMERAASVFYDYVINYAPEMLSPQHEAFYQAAQESIKNSNGEQKSNDHYLTELHDAMNLGTLSQAFAGLESLALSYRKDVNREDYLNEFYENYVLPEDKYVKEMEYGRFFKQQHVLMERSYLRAWKVFSDESEKLLPYFRDLVNLDKDNLDAQLNGLTGLAAIRFDEPQLRKQIVQNALDLLAKNKNPSAQGIKGGLIGLAQSSTLDENAKELAKKLTQKVNHNQYTFSEQINIMWALCALQQYESQALRNIIKSFNKLNFERLDNDLRYREYDRLMEAIQALKLEAPKNVQITNKTILAGFDGQHGYRNSRFPETYANYDPFKRRVLHALAKGLSEASIQHEVIMENELVNQQVADQTILNEHKYPYKPDLIMGYKNQKVGLFVLPETYATKDTYQPTGEQRFRMRLLEKAQKGEIQTAAVAIGQVINFDIEKYQLAINRSFNFKQVLDQQVKVSADQQLSDFSQLSDFALDLVTRAANFTPSLPDDADVRRMDIFMKKLAQCFQIKQQMELKFDVSQRNIGRDELRFQLMLAGIQYDNLNPQCKHFVKQSLPQGYDSLKTLLMEHAQQLKHEEDKSVKPLPEQLDKNWLGTRLEVELPQVPNSEFTKSIVPEMINQRFMWVQDYFHYQDWQQKQKAVFDNFNLLQIPLHKDQHKFFFEKDYHHRRIPQGVFPHPNHKRQVLKPHAQVYELELARQKGQNDEMVLFEKEPFKMMILKEFQKIETQKPIDQETSMITNLQNIKQGLKSDYSDKEILNIVLLNLNFTEKLIEEHLGQLKLDNQKQPKYLQRDPKAYRQFVQSTYHSKDREDPFSHYYLKEANKIEPMIDEVIEFKKKKEHHEENTFSQEKLSKYKQREKKLWEKIDNVLLQDYLSSDDFLNISTVNKTDYTINYDMKSLVKSEFIYDVEPELLDSGLTDQEYLDLSRARSESKLIKMKIIYKLNQEQELTVNEKKYLKNWLHDIQQNQDRNVLNLRDSLLPEKPSKLSLNDVDAQSLYALNSITKVQFDREQHGQYALNELVLELSHFLDEEVINKVETEVYSDRLRKDWGISNDFKVIETRNKEISLVLNELEELAFRASGQFNDTDHEGIVKMYSLKRNRDVFDRSYYEMDLKSLKEFMNAANPYDDRIKLVEQWLQRKEVEFEERQALAPQSLRKSDFELHAEYDRSLKAARERLVSKLLVADEYGNKINKEYKDMTSRELHIISENLAVRLYLFNYDYPIFLPQAIEAITSHPNLQQSDRNLIETYCKIFELDWRGEKNAASRDDLLCHSPIPLIGTNVKSYGAVTKETVNEMIRRACAPYVDQAAHSLLNYKL